MQTSRDDSSWIIIGILVAGFLVWYAFNSYTDLAQREQAYLYHPQSGDIYSVDLAPLVSSFRKWEPFIPFKRITYSEPTEAEYLGRLDEILEEKRKDRELMDRDTDAWMEKQRQELDRRMSELSDGEFMIEHADIAYAVRHIEGQVDKLGESLEQVIGQTELRQGEVLSVDAVVIRTSYPLEKAEQAPPPSITVLRDSYLLKGAAAAVLNQAGVR